MRLYDIAEKFDALNAHPEGGFIDVGQILPPVKLIFGERLISKEPQNDPPFWWSFFSYFSLAKNALEI